MITKKIIIITQDEPIFIARSIELLIRRLPKEFCVSGVIILDGSPFGARKSFLQKILGTARIFGFHFLFVYGVKFLVAKASKRDLKRVLAEFGIKIISAGADINSSKSRKAIAAEDPDLLISITANQIFGEKLLKIPKLCTLNLHSSLLPKYRGLLPTFWALKDGVKSTGVSVFEVDGGIDSGPIVVQKKISIDVKLTQWRLIEFTKYMGVEAMIEALSVIYSGNKKRLQNDKHASTYRRFPTQNDVKYFKQSGNRFF